MCDVVLGSAEYHFRSLAAGQAAQHTQKIIAVHFWHIPIKQNRVGKFALTSLDGLLAVRGFENLKLKIFQNSPRDLADDTGVINNQTRFHGALALTAGCSNRSFLGRSCSAADIQYPVRIKHHEKRLIQAEYSGRYAA